MLMVHGERQRRDKATADIVHAVPDAGAGEGVPLQPVPDSEAADRDRTRPLPHGETDKDLVPEQEDEVEEGAQDGQYEHRYLPDAPALPAGRSRLSPPAPPPFLAGPPSPAIPPPPTTPAPFLPFGKPWRR
ncbi:hypothetical protein J437_LFUL000635 [Ladona fulva]|uniref:Uncharacterized protein n=1 Tax=Ladona fulva TaxID=123851 RepID=A0A8K0NYM6_LADFU|nr:hypothetical protein J437_LFUL000635 [Ladona fulva]